VAIAAVVSSIVTILIGVLKNVLNKITDKFIDSCFINRKKNAEYKADLADRLLRVCSPMGAILKAEC
jgi:hypothetical protein